MQKRKNDDRRKLLAPGAQNLGGGPELENR